MTLTVDISYQAGSRDCGAWIQVFGLDADAIAIKINTVCNMVYNQFDGGDAEVSVVLADNVFVQGLNNQYRGKDKPTNVLSFSASDGFEIDGMVEHLGDIIIAFETVVSESDEQEKSFENHFMHLVLHGMLHLLGFDHITPDEAEEMESLEIELLQKLGVNDPYMGTDVVG